MHPYRNPFSVPEYKYTGSVIDYSFPAAGSEHTHRLSFKASIHFLVVPMYLPALFAALFLSIPFAYGIDFYPPADKGGSMLDLSNGLGEPLNVIISGDSSREILSKSGFHLYAYVVGFAIECFGQHQGTRQKANLGDGRGWTDEIEVLREHFGIPGLGTCLQSLAGGNHFRVWQQTGAEANSSALFLAVSQEEDLAQQHTIVPNGYNIGRDKFVNQAVGTKYFFPKRYITTVKDLPNLLPAGSAGINHGIAQDGVVKLLTVQVKFVWQF